MRAAAGDGNGSVGKGAKVAPPGKGVHIDDSIHVLGDRAAGRPQLKGSRVMYAVCGLLSLTRDS
jgi:hypothetical protein